MIFPQDILFQWRISPKGNTYDKRDTIKFILAGIPWQFTSQLGLSGLTTEGPGSVLDWGTKISQAAWHGPKFNNNNNTGI